MMWGSYLNGPWAWILVALMNLVFWGILIAGIVWVVRTLSRPSEARAQQPLPMDSARRILEERFARGEIDQEEFQQRWSVLSGQGPAR